MSTHSLIDRIREDKDLLERHQLTEDELAFIETVSFFGNLKTVDDVLFILKNIRATRRQTDEP
jgi:hypothetical protein